MRACILPELPRAEGGIGEELRLRLFFSSTGCSRAPFDRPAANMPPILQEDTYHAEVRQFVRVAIAHYWVLVYGEVSGVSTL